MLLKYIKIQLQIQSYNLRYFFLNFDQCPPLYYFCSGANLIISSILKIVIAASVANLIELILEIIGYKTPDFKLFLGLPAIKSNPQYFNCNFF